AGRTCFETTGFLAMLANVGEKDPAKWIFSIGYRSNDLVSFLSILFDEHHVAPGRRAEMAGVVVGISGPTESVVWHFIPFFARDFAGFATDANGWVGEESDFDMILYIGMFPLVRALNSFADHRLSPSVP